LTSNDLLLDGFGRIREIVLEVLDDLSPGQLEYRAGPEANSICWLIWHLTRVQDDHVAGAGGLDQVYLAGGWADQFALPLDPLDIGYGHSSDDVALVRATPELLAGYHEATYEQTAAFVSGLTEADLARVVDRNWDPPVTMAVRFVSVLADDLEHAGQAAFIRGLTEAS
jgi:uncharacterized damage-inducible protein DinB